LLAWCLLLAYVAGLCAAASTLQRGHREATDGKPVAFAPGISGGMPPLSGLHQRLIGLSCWNFLPSSNSYKSQPCGFAWLASASVVARCLGIVAGVWSSPLG
jgi:hypothetical protein